MTVNVSIGWLPAPAQRPDVSSMGRRLHEFGPVRARFHTGYNDCMLAALSWQLLLAMLLNGVVQAVGIAAYAARLAGALSGRAATAMSLFNIFVTTSRFASMLYTPMLGVLSDSTTPGTLYVFQMQLRAIMVAGMVGAIAGTLLIPTFVHIYLRAIRSLDRHGSIPKVIARLFNLPRTVRNMSVRPTINSSAGRFQCSAFRKTSSY
jgi:hypothetical protein